MAKLTINDITSGYVSTTAINTAFTAIETALENTLSRDGTSPNSMSADLDMNGNDILNVGDMLVGGVGLAASVTAAAASAAAADVSADAALASEVAAAASEAIVVASADNLADLEYRGAWTVATAYLKNNIVYYSTDGSSYICLVSHESDAADFSIDLGLGRWGLLAIKGAAGAGTGDMLKSENLSGLANYTTARSNLGLTIGTHVQAYSANLAAFASLTTGAASGNVPLVGTSSATEALAGLVELATQAEAEAGADDTVVMTPLKTAQAIAALGFGSGQAWQDVTASRATGTTYTNSTGRPIQIAVALTMTIGTSAGFVISGVILQGSWSGGGGGCSNLFAVVPAGATYSANSVSVSVILNWSELR